MPFSSPDILLRSRRSPTEESTLMVNGSAAVAPSVGRLPRAHTRTVKTVSPSPRPTAEVQFCKYSARETITAISRAVYTGQLAFTACLCRLPTNRGIARRLYFPRQPNFMPVYTARKTAVAGRVLRFRAPCIPTLRLPLLICLLLILIQIKLIVI